MYYNWEKVTNTEELKVVCNLIKNGELVIFPTETVYGIGANALDPMAVGKIFFAKERNSDNPLIVHLADKRKIEDIAQDITDVEQKLIDAFMPGPFTLILKKKPIIPDIVTTGLDTVAVRIPDNIIAKGIIQFSGVPLVVPCACKSGMPSGTKIEDIRKELEGKVSAIVDGGQSQIGIESTIVKVEDEVPVILRPGKVLPEDIEKVIGNVRIDRSVLGLISNNVKFENLGMKNNEYEPTTKCKLIACLREIDQIYYLKNYIQEYQGNVVIVGYEEHKDKFLIDNDRFISFGSRDNMDEIAKNLYYAIRKADSIRPAIILIEGVEKDGMGLAVMNRLLKICSYDVIYR